MYEVAPTASSLNDLENQAQLPSCEVYGRIMNCRVNITYFFLSR